MKIQVVGLETQPAIIEVLVESPLNQDSILLIRQYGEEMDDKYFPSEYDYEK